MMFWVAPSLLLLFLLSLFSFLLLFCFLISLFSLCFLLSFPSWSLFSFLLLFCFLIFLLSFLFVFFFLSPLGLQISSSIFLNSLHFFYFSLSSPSSFPHLLFPHQSARWRLSSCLCPPSPLPPPPPPAGPPRRPELSPRLHPSAATTWRRESAGSWKVKLKPIALWEDPMRSLWTGGLEG